MLSLSSSVTATLIMPDSCSSPVGASSLHLYCGQRFPDIPLLLPQRNVLTIVLNSEHRTMNIFQRGRNLGDFFSFHRLLSGHFRKWSVPRRQELKQGSGYFSRNGEESLWGTELSLAKVKLNMCHRGPRVLRVLSGDTVTCRIRRHSGCLPGVL